MIREVHKKFVQNVRVFPSNGVRHMRQGRTRRSGDEDGGGDVPDLIEMFDGQKRRRFGFISADESIGESVPPFVDTLASVEPTVSPRRVPNVQQGTAAIVSGSADQNGTGARKTVSSDEALRALKNASAELLARNARITTQVLAEAAGAIVGWKASTMYKFIHQTLDTDEREELGLKVRTANV